MYGQRTKMNGHPRFAAHAGKISLCYQSQATNMRTRSIQYLILVSGLAFGASALAGVGPTNAGVTTTVPSGSDPTLGGSAIAIVRIRTTEPAVGESIRHSAARTRSHCRAGLRTMPANRAQPRQATRQIQILRKPEKMALPLLRRRLHRHHRHHLRSIIQSLNR